MLPLTDYVASYPDVFAGCDTTKPTYALLDEWLRRHPENRYLVASCTDEAAVVETVSPLRLGVAVPPEVLSRLVFKSGGKESPLRGVVGGELPNSLGLQGMYRRLAKRSAVELEALLRDA